MLYNENNNHKKEIYPFNLFKDIITSQVVLKAYEEVLEELYKVKTSKNKIKNIINDFFKTHSIYFLPMSNRLFGMTLHNGTIVINRQYYSAGYSVELAFLILWTLLHEIMHVLSRLKRKNKNFFLDTSEFTKLGNITSEESGNYFEDKLLLNVLGKKYLTFFETEYLLKKMNYNYKTVDEFQKAFI